MVFSYTACNSSIDQVKILAQCVNQYTSILSNMNLFTYKNRDKLMSKYDIQNYGVKDLTELATFWRRLIAELEVKNPEDVLPEMREALAETEACLEELTAVSIY